MAADVSRARETLGVRAENAIQREIEQTRAAYDRLKRSGVASQNELRRASEATKQRVRELNAELGKTSFGDKAGSFGRGLMGAGLELLQVQQWLASLQEIKWNLIDSLQW